VRARAALLWLAPPALVVAGPLAAGATVYLTADEARQAIFPGLAFTRAGVELSEQQAAAIEERSGVTVRRRALEAWRGPSGETFFVDRVLGKHEDILYALGVGADGRVAGLEILEYRETYGGQVREEAWRRQFAGKSLADPLKLGGDITNVSGATLSCRHVTDGVRRLLATRALLFG
jgi:Na+-translocating ferredoxin:NAD+ oxidoreductase RnfG subunit